MKKMLTILLTLLSLEVYTQDYPLGELEFTDENEQATEFTSYDPQHYPNLPSQIDLSGMLPPCGNQGSKGSCWAWATAYIIRTIIDENKPYIKDDRVDHNKVYSPEFVYQYYKGNKSDCNWGAISSIMLARILNDGVVKFVDFPYDENWCNYQPSAALVAKAKTFRKPEYSVEVVYDLFSVKKILADGHPLIISMKVDNFFATRGNITSVSPYWRTFGIKKGTHAMIVVGYDDNAQLLKVLNSWGPKFGSNGYVWISYSIIQAAMNYSCYPKKREVKELPLTKNSREESNEAFVNLTSNEQSTWFKEGYYRRFDNLKIVLADLNRRKKFAIIEIRDEAYQLKTNFYIALKTSKVFYVGKDRYRFTFDEIGKEGRNPFKKAVFFTMERLPVLK